MFFPPPPPSSSGERSPAPKLNQTLIVLGFGAEFVICDR